MASGADERVPSWLRSGDPENRIPVLIALLVAIGLQLAIPRSYTVVPRWPLIVLEILLVVVLVGLNPLRLSRRTRSGQWASYLLLAAITLDNSLSALFLNIRILTGDVSNNAAVLLGSGGAIYVTTVIAFGIWYWELDRGGPFARREGRKPYPDFMFPQMTEPELAPPNWRPEFFDYLYVSITNVVAFSPTDTMPMTRRAKMLMTGQAVISFTTLGLVIARAVNVLG
ncbi:hypothetical protein H7J93_05060 [Mycobacterium barrassiae]|nr:DUF1345 domain-containing protein [Mycobacterium barrassiae]MCV7299005.1 hypothetical protein [Mycobacterium barrassiae]